MDKIQLRAITEIARGGFDILQIFQPGASEPIYFLVYKFQEAFFNTAQSVEYNVVEGIDITDFMERNANMANNVVEFNNNLQRTIDKSSVMRIQFSKETVYYKWSMSGVAKR